MVRHQVDGNNGIPHILHLAEVGVHKMDQEAHHHLDNGVLKVKGVVHILHMVLNHPDHGAHLECKVSQECDRHIDQI